MKTIFKVLVSVFVPSLCMAGVHIQQGDNATLGVVNAISLTCSGSPCGTGTGAGGVTVYPATATASFPFGISASTIQVNGSGAGTYSATEGSPPSGIANQDVLWADSADHTYKFIPNNGSTYFVVGSSNAPSVGHVAIWSTAGTLIDGGQKGGNAILNQSTLQAGATAYPDFVYIGTSLTVNGPSVLQATMTINTVSVSSFTNVSSTTFANIYVDMTPGSTLYASALNVTSSMTVVNVSSFTITNMFFDVSASTEAAGTFYLQSYPSAFIKPKVPYKVGQLYQCSDCATVPVCISTGTAAYQWSLITNKGSACQ
jgi:hypothetical protein